MPLFEFIIGTRPELIKVAPVIRECYNLGLKDQIRIVNTAQHRELLDPYWRLFELVPDVTLDSMVAGQGLVSLTARVLTQLQNHLNEQAEKPDLILAQGDTTTVMAASMVAFYNRIDFVHLEAGLRSNDFDNPFPEEYNRKVAAIAARLHLAPTTKSAENLRAEGVPAEKIHVVGNTVIDALGYFRQQPAFTSEPVKHPGLEHLADRQVVLITCHRRENHGENLQQIIRAVLRLAVSHPELQFVWSVHPNPNVKLALKDSLLSTAENVTLTDPLDYYELLKVMRRSSLILTDSGGIQEEAPSFGVPVVVLRETTERPEGVEQGAAVLAGADEAKIIGYAEQALKRGAFSMANPYGDGKSAERIVALLTGLKGS